MTHALLSPSGAHRWLVCPPSARLGEKFPDEPSVYAIEGNTAHEIAEAVLRARLNGLNVPEIENVEVLEAANTYADYVLELIGTRKHVPVSLEVRSDYSAYVPDGFGTADCVLVLEDVIHIIDFKYGMGIKVSAKDNPQLKLYALGVYSSLKDILDITNISVHIVQPRIQNIDSDVMSVESLLDWAKSIRAVAELAWKGEGDFSVGEHCRFCRAKERCAARVEYFKKLYKPTLSDEDYDEILPQVRALVEWAKDVESKALDLALKGKGFKNFVLKEGRNSRFITEPEKAAQILERAGFDPYEPPSLLGIGKLEKLLGKERFLELLGECTAEKKGAKKLVFKKDYKRSAEEAFSQ